MTQKACVEGLRALVLYTASIQDEVARRRRRRPRTSPPTRRSTTCCCRSSRATAPRSLRAAREESLQCFGGSGYLQDYPLEQYVRDAKIDTLYEGTTGHPGPWTCSSARSSRDQGRALTAPDDRGRRRSPRVTAGNGVARPGARACSARAVEDVQAIVGAMVGQFASAPGRRTQRLQGRREHDPPALRARRPRRARGCCCVGRGRADRARRVAPAAARAPSTRARSRRPGGSPAGAAAARRRARTRRGHRQRRHGPPRGRLLGRSRDGALPPDALSGGRVAGFTRRPWCGAAAATLATMAIATDNPATGETVKIFDAHTPEQVEAALARPHATFRSWRRRPSPSGPR